jgi:trehalose-6-phosphate synthase
MQRLAMDSAPRRVSSAWIVAALIVNPYLSHEMSERIDGAIEMNLVEIRRWKGRMRSQVKENNIHKSACEIIRKRPKLT